MWLDPSVAEPADRPSVSDRGIRNLRPPKRAVDPRRAYAVTWEEERDTEGRLVPTAVVFLTNRECPFTCVMCDLWRHTLDAPVQRGDIPHQIRCALAEIVAGRPGLLSGSTHRKVDPVSTSQIKLYNAGSFFDPGAIPPEDDEEIAELVAPFARVIVEAHPAFLRGAAGERCLRFRDRLKGRLEVAVGLETAQAETLARLNKRMTLDDFAAAASFLRRHDIDLRVFILLAPPFLPPGEARAWACRSIDVAYDAGAGVCAVIPTRGGNGVMETLGAAFTPPDLRDLEAVVEYGLTVGRGRVFADEWDLDRLHHCACSPGRVARLRAMNREQRLQPPIVCDCAPRH